MAQIELPNLNKYKQEFVLQGITIPVTPVTHASTGLLSQLPPPPSGKTGWPWTVETPPCAKNISNGLPYPKISIVTPSYNQGQFLEETIRSVLLQNYPNLEYIICDGGSTDETIEIIEKYSPWLSYWQSKKDRGQGHAINLGFSIASGDYFGWLNSDDFYMPHSLQKVGLLAYQNQAEFIYGDAINLDDNQNKIDYWQANLVRDSYLRFGGLIASHSAFWKSDIHQPIWEKMNCNVDGELWIRLVAGTKKKHLNFPLGVFRVQQEAKTSHERYLNLWREDGKNIAAVYGEPPKARSYLIYEFIIVQRMYKQITKQLSSKQMKNLIQQCAWKDKFIYED